jgi:hypothetical protein
MSRVRTTLTLLSAAMISLSGPAFAESIERTFKPAPSRNVMSILNGAESNGPAANQIPAQQTPSVVDGRTINITQPSVPDTVRQDEPQRQPRQAAPAPQQPVQRQPVKRAEQAPGRSRDSEVSESDWWKDTGNPKVFAFRDCISGYARAQAQVRPKVNLQGILAEAIKGDCKSSFSNVSAVLAERFGSRKAKKMASELTGSTFVPALRSAVLDVRKQQKAARRQQERAQAVATAPQAAPVQALQQPQPANAPARAPVAAATPAAPQPVGPQLDVAIAKEDMFKCYRGQTDRLGGQPQGSVDEVVDQVLLECSDHTRAFFARLFSAYPVAPARQSEKMRQTIAENYRPAIAERVNALRTSNVVGGAGGASTVVKSATTSASQ